MSELNCVDKKLSELINLDNETLILDFDHTLFLSNSTEEYLACAQPAILTGLVLALIEGLKPWRLFPGGNSRFVYRDAIRVLAITIFFPWTFLVWKLRANKLASEYANAEILGVLDHSNWKNVVIATNGFGFIVKELLKSFNSTHEFVVLSSNFGNIANGIRRQGKLAYLKSCYPGLVDFSKATFISDNEDDLDLMGVVSNPVSLTWEGAKHFRAHENVYIPFVYTEGSNRGNSGHVVNTILLTNYLILILTYGFSAGLSVSLALGLLFLSISFWCVYEAGYYENDFHEVNYESTGGDGKKILKFKDYPAEVGAWTWGFCLGLAGIYCLIRGDIISSSSPVEFCSYLLLWLAWLLVVRLVFKVYNYSILELRVLIYPVLQLFRMAGPLLFVPLNILGIFLIVSQAISRWFWYLIYRTGGDRKKAPHHIVRIVIFVSLVILHAYSEKNLDIFVSWQFLLMSAWLLARSIPQFLMFFRGKVFVKLVGC
ncbi:MAG: haloacid dehalogenase-like hydrolase [Nodularia sp. (in: Bacteria)]|nr:MAG: haloacid dehalogenase-like hydrolase [Nodularia sp. (in: cyanobacteria)]